MSHLTQWEYDMIVNAYNCGIISLEEERKLINDLEIYYWREMCLVL